MVITTITAARTAIIAVTAAVILTFRRLLSGASAVSFRMEEEGIAGEIFCILSRAGVSAAAEAVADACAPVVAAPVAPIAAPAPAEGAGEALCTIIGEADGTAATVTWKEADFPL